MDFGKLLKTSWDRFVSEIVNLVLFVLVGAVLSMTIVLIPSVVMGWTRGFLDFAREGKSPEFNLLWDFGGYLNALLFMIVGGVLVTIGYSLFIIPGFLISILLMYTFLLMVDRNLGFWEAMVASKDFVMQTGFQNHLVVMIILVVLGLLGGLAWGFGALLTAPYSAVVLSCAYLEFAEQASGTATESAENP